MAGTPYLNNEELRLIGIAINYYMKSLDVSNYEQSCQQVTLDTVIFKLNRFTPKTIYNERFPRRVDPLTKDEKNKLSFLRAMADRKLREDSATGNEITY